jgi:ABC-type antimicrobial peptide transport system permease subunit
VLIQMAVSLALGLVGAVVAGMALEGLLVDVHANDPTLLAGVSGVLAAIVVFASVLPAVRASRIDPAITLRAE